MRMSHNHRKRPSYLSGVAYLPQNSSCLDTSLFLSKFRLPALYMRLEYDDKLHQQTSYLATTLKFLDVTEF